MSKKIVDYVIIRATLDMYGLAAMVEDYLARGWQPLGGVACDSQYFLQAMVRYESEKNPPNEGIEVIGEEQEFHIDPGLEAENARLRARIADLEHQLVTGGVDLPESRCPAQVELDAAKQRIVNLEDILGIAENDVAEMRKEKDRLHRLVAYTCRLWKKIPSSVIDEVVMPYTTSWALYFRHFSAHMEETAERECVDDAKH